MKTKNENTLVKEIVIDAAKMEEMGTDPSLLQKAEDRHRITGPDAEDIRSLNRSLTNLRMEISAQVIIRDLYVKQQNEINKKYKESTDKEEGFLVDFAKKSAELQKVVDTAFNKLKLNAADKWQFDTEACVFHKGV